MSPNHSFLIYRSNLHCKLFPRVKHGLPGGSVFFSTTLKIQKAAQKVSSSATVSAETVSHLGTDPNRLVGRWLLTCSGLVFGMVVVGGLTRLTKSGLSMTDWKFHGGFPPVGDKAWAAEFSKYQHFPEFQRINQNMTLAEFKSIYSWEYAHRMYGRFIGLAFTLPLVYYAARGHITRVMYKPLASLFVLGASQGLIGWWMVKSGLQHDGNQTYNDLPRVSPYRLATHLGFAFVLYAGLMYNGLYVFAQRHATHQVLQQLELSGSQPGKYGAHTMYRRSVYALTCLTASTALMGAFVAGNDAGLVYNEWPKMGTGYVPSDLVNPGIEPKWRNMFENCTTIQFVHRNLAYCTVLASIALFAYSTKMHGMRRITSNLLYASGGLMSLALLQSGLGILTLINHIPISLASMHQAGSLTVLGAAVYLAFLSRRNGYGASTRLMNQLLKTGKPSFLVV